MKIIECVPNFSEGKDSSIINKILNTIKTVPTIKLLNSDIGIDTNRTVVTFAGHPSNVIEAAFRGIKMASEIIDLRNHIGTHARMGSTDVCPLVPISNISMNECIKYSIILAKRVADELDIPVYLYEESATSGKRHNLANIRSGEFEGMDAKLKLDDWKPDFGPPNIHQSAGVIAIGARNILIAYNVNLNTQDKKIATDIALDIRTQGRNKRDKNGKFKRDKSGTPIKVAGTLSDCKAVGWYINEYKQAQVSINLTNIEVTPLHIAFEEVCRQARRRGLRVSGSELVGLVPLDSMILAGKYYLRLQRRSTGIPTKDIIHIAVKSMGLDDLFPFKPDEKIIEYQINDLYGVLASKTIYEFNDELSSDSPAPGGGSVSALAGTLAASLTSMVSNLTIGKKKWDKLYNKMCLIGDKSQSLKKELLTLIDADTDAFNQVLKSYRLPKKSKSQQKIRTKEINNSIKGAADIPFKTLKCCSEVMKYTKEVAKFGNPNSITDAGVAGEIAYAGAQGAALNVKINLLEIEDVKYCKNMIKKTNNLLDDSRKTLNIIRKMVANKIDNNGNTSA